MATLKQQRADEQTDAIDKLRELLPPGSRVHTVLRHVSRSGMSRSISPVVTVDGEPHDITYLVARVGFTFDRNHGGIKMDGAGMDMGFALVYALSRTLYPDAFDCIGDRCPANDHSNGDRDYTPHRHTDGGYALRHEWL